MDAKFGDLLGKTIEKIDGSVGSDEVRFFTTDGDVYMQYYVNFAGSTVKVNSIDGEWENVIGSPIIIADESAGAKTKDDSAFTWAAFDLATANGSVKISWKGRSEAVYADVVDFEKES